MSQLLFQFGNYQIRQVSCPWYFSPTNNGFLQHFQGETLLILTSRCIQPEERCTYDAGTGCYKLTKIFRFVFEQRRSTSSALSG